MSGKYSILIASAKKVFSREGWSLLLIMLIGSALQGVLMSLLDRSYDGEWQSTPLLFLVTFVPLYVIAVPIGLWILRKNETKAPAEHELGFSKWLLSFVICVFLLYSGSIIGVVISMLLTPAGFGIPLPCTWWSTSWGR